MHLLSGIKTKSVEKIFYLHNLLFFSEERAIPTHLTEREKLQLFLLAKNVQGECLVEIGSYLGASSSFIAAGIRSTNNPNGKLFCVDTWTNIAMPEAQRDTFEDFINNTRKSRNQIVTIRSDSKEAACSFSQPVSFLFIDADHSYEGVRGDVEAWFPLLRPGAIVVFHDIGWAPGVQQVIREFVTQKALKEGNLPNMYWARI
ncbi:MAG: class I SAM-dependent methyltransferase [Actinobacteria bacterium]|nr:class I SAM-dependent methyltransferase [Actinomycetota bacterium]